MADPPWEKYGTQDGPWKKWGDAKSFGRDVADTARITGTAVAEGVGNVGNLASQVLGPPPDVVTKTLGFTPLARRPGGAKAAMDRMGIPTDPAKEAARLGAEMTPLRKGLSSAARIGTEAALMGAGTGAAAMAGVGGGLGNVVGGEAGELIGSIGLPMAALGASRGLAARATRPPAADALRAQASQAYRDAENAGVIVSQRALRRFEQGVRGDMARQGMDEVLHPRVTQAMRRVAEDAGRGHMTLEGADILRRVMRNAASSADASERRLAMRMVSRLDDFIGNLRPADLVQGDLNGVLRLTQARNLWSRSAKAETIQEMVERAGTRAPNFSASGLENSLRTEFRQLALNPRRMRMFTQAEQAAIRRVAEGDPLTNVLRFVGRFAPKGVITGALHGANIAANPGLGISMAIGAQGARMAATGLTQRNVRLASELMRRGGPAPARNLTALDRTALNAILFGGAAAAAD